MRVMAIILVAALAATSAGCIENMHDLKAALGVKAPAEPIVPEQVYLPPLARAQANATMVHVSAPVRFSAEGTRDPQELPLTYAWAFGDGATAPGLDAVHAYAAPGEYRIQLTVTNAKGLTDGSALVVQVARGNFPPVAVVDVPVSGDAAQQLSFDATRSTDPDGDKLAYAWDFGDGATSLEAKATHAFADAGVHVVKLRVTDPSGASSDALASVAISKSGSATGSFGPTDSAAQDQKLAVPEGAKLVNATLTFPAGLGANDLVLILKDSTGKEVQRTNGGPATGSQDAQVRALVITSEQLKGFTAGGWTLSVVKNSGVMIDYALSWRVAC